MYSMTKDVICSNEVAQAEERKGRQRGMKSSYYGPRREVAGLKRYHSSNKSLPISGASICSDVRAPPLPSHPGTRGGGHSLHVLPGVTAKVPYASIIQPTTRTNEKRACKVVGAEFATDDVRRRAGGLTTSTHTDSSSGAVRSSPQRQSGGVSESSLSTWPNRSRNFRLKRLAYSAARVTGISGAASCVLLPCQKSSDCLHQRIFLGRA